MRIIGGKYRGKKIIAPNNIKARPTTDFAKESLFNILGNRIDFEGKQVLDLFAGTGNISYEFASRGVEHIHSVDIAQASYRFIKSFCIRNDIKEISVQKIDTMRYLRNCKHQYDIIFADPPYDLKEMVKIPELVFENDLLKEDGMLIVEHGKETNLQECINWQEDRVYSRVNFSFFYR